MKIKCDGPLQISIIVLHNSNKIHIIFYILNTLYFLAVVEVTLMFAAGHMNRTKIVGTSK